MTMNTQCRIDLGKRGENLACVYLKSKGYVILTKNFRCRRYGEIDIIAVKDGVLSFIEVKTRASERYGPPREAVTAAKQRKIYRCAEYYLQCSHLIEHMPVLSFDVIEIIIKGSVVQRLQHFPHCF